MTLKCTITAVLLSMLWLPGVALSQGLFEDDPAESTRYTRSERVGETMWRVKPQNTPYDQWFEKNKKRIPTFEGLVIQDARTVPLQPWEDMGVDGLYLKMADYQITDGWILELPPRGKTKKQRHLFEAGVYFFGGPGHIEIQQEGKSVHWIEFKYRTLFSIPLNVQYQIFNDSATCRRGPHSGDTRYWHRPHARLGIGGCRGRGPPPLPTSHLHRRFSHTSPGAR